MKKIKLPRTLTAPPERNIWCDVCNRFIHPHHDSGGFILYGYAYCPDCAEKQLGNICAHGEDKDISDRCPAGLSFADWIRGLRLAAKEATHAA